MPNNYGRPFLWKVKYNYDFHYGGPEDSHESSEGFVVTDGNSLTDVVNAIKQGISCQEILTKLVEVEWLGYVLNQRNKLEHPPHDW